MQPAQPPSPSLLLRWACLLAGLAAVLPALGATNVWFAVGGTGDGTGPDRPRKYDANFVNFGLLHTTPGLDHDVNLHFLPGEYLTTPINTVATEPTDFRISIRGEGQHPEDVVLKLAPNLPDGASDGGSSWVNVIDLARNNEYLRRFVLENITIDGNWSGSSQYNHRAYLRGYKISPVYASARTGRIRNVIVRNFGAHGVMPQRSQDLNTGVEVFPIFIQTRDEGQEPEEGDPRPWVVEDCQVSEFTGLYGGYTTCLMAVTRLNVPNTPKWAWDDSRRRLVWFHRNQILGVPGEVNLIGQGAAGSGTNYVGKVTFSDNVVLNGRAFNTDTGSLRFLDFTNSLFLDVAALGYVGTPFVGHPMMTGYDISGNSVRLAAAALPRDYSDFVYTNLDRGQIGTRADTSDPGWAGPQVYHNSGLVILGIAQDIRMADNWFTTVPQDQFARRHTPASRDPVFRLVYRKPPKDPEDPTGLMLPRADALDVDFSGNQISAFPFDFVRLKPIGGGRVAKLVDGASPLLEARSAVPLAGKFVPAGVVERVALTYTNVPRRFEWSDGRKLKGFSTNDRVLIGAVEVVFGMPLPPAGDGKFQIPVRVAFQPTPYSGSAGTWPLKGRRLFLETLPGSLHSQKLSATTDEYGVALFRFDVGAGENGVDYFRAWTDAGSGRPEAWDQYQDAWATFSFAHGVTVGAFVESDVADARSGTPGRIRLLRTGPADRALTVKFAFAPGPYAAEAGRDFQITGRSRPKFPGGKGEDAAALGSSVEFEAGRREVVLQVEPIAKTARSAKLVKLQVQAGDGYAAGDPASGEVVIYAPGK